MDPLIRESGPQPGVDCKLYFLPGDLSLGPDDLLVVVMGLTGAGKSSFINRFCGHEFGFMKVNHGLQSCTEQIDVGLYTLPPTHPIYPGRRLVLVDTPGFDDSSSQGDFETLRRISVWLADVYERNNMRVEIAGFVYLHSINQTRMSGSAVLAYQVFCAMCGPIALETVVFASTQWDALYNPLAGPVREIDLKEFWSTSLARGATYKRVGATNPERDTEEIIEHILRKHSLAPRMTKIRIQEELVELGKRVVETEAAQILRSTLRKQLGYHNGEG